VLSVKPLYERRAALNLIGGEPFAHPDIVDILKYSHELYQREYRERWKISVVITTNGLAGPKIVDRCRDFIDQWTISYHTETLEKQKSLVIKNIMNLHNKGQKVEVRVMAHPQPDKFQEAQSVHEMLKAKGVNALFKPINKANYDNARYFRINWQTKKTSQNDDLNSSYNTDKGICCCAERPLILDHDRSKVVKFIPDNNFKGWYCALNWHFLFVEYDKNVYHNMSCRISHKTGRREPIGTIDDYDKILDDLQQQIQDKKVKVLRCPKDRCVGCGMCATKASTVQGLREAMKHRLIDVDILDFADIEGQPN
jgi:MoaA/NifB/PqqE/SkfB family radical SAM enzyme